MTQGEPPPGGGHRQAAVASAAPRAHAGATSAGLPGLRPGRVRGAGHPHGREPGGHPGLRQGRRAARLPAALRRHAGRGRGRRRRRGGQRGRARRRRAVGPRRRAPGRSPGSAAASRSPRRRHLGHRVRAARARRPRRGDRRARGPPDPAQVIVEAANGPDHVRRPGRARRAGHRRRARHPGQRRWRHRRRTSSGPRAARATPGTTSVVAERLRTRMDDAFVAVWARAQTLGVGLRRGAVRRRPRAHRRRHRGPGALPASGVLLVSCRARPAGDRRGGGVVRGRPRRQRHRPPAAHRSHRRRRSSSGWSSSSTTSTCPATTSGRAFEPVAERFGMRWSLRFTDERPAGGGARLARSRTASTTCSTAGAPVSWPSTCRSS